MHLVQVCDLLTKEVRWVNISQSPQTVLRAYDWAAIGAWSSHPDLKNW